MHNTQWLKNVTFLMSKVKITSSKTADCRVWCLVMTNKHYIGHATGRKELLLLCSFRLSSQKSSHQSQNLSRTHSLYRFPLNFFCKLAVQQLTEAITMDPYFNPYMTLSSLMCLLSVSSPSKLPACFHLLLVLTGFNQFNKFSLSIVHIHHSAVLNVDC